MHFAIYPEIEDVNTLVMYESDCDKVKLQFTRNAVIGCNKLIALVAMDPYKSLETDVNKDIVVSGASFMLTINS